MLIYRGGQNAGKGTYWNVAHGKRVDADGQGRLPGDSGAVYIKMPAAAMVMLAPVLGLLFAVFLPFIGIAMTMTLIARKAAGGLREAAAKSLSFGWRPAEAYLAGKRKKAGKGRRRKEQQDAGKK